MALFITLVVVLVAIGIWVVVRSGERELDMDEKDRKLQKVMQPELDEILPPTPKPPASEEESWTQESIEEPLGDANRH